MLRRTLHGCDLDHPLKVANGHELCIVRNICFCMHLRPNADMRAASGMADNHSIEHALQTPVLHTSSAPDGDILTLNEV
jgi:hypothetical protein